MSAKSCPYPSVDRTWCVCFAKLARIRPPLVGVSPDSTELGGITTKLGAVFAKFARLRGNLVGILEVSTEIDQLHPNLSEVQPK